ncbi:hypothetical protein ACFE04_010299 [Oxalis oulophora]
MADRSQAPLHLRQQPYPAGGKGEPAAGFMQRGFGAGGGPSASKIMAVLTAVPVGGTLFFLAGMSFIGTVIGLCVCTPLFIIFSPVLVPAGIAIGLAVFAFLTSGAFGLTGLSAMYYMVTYLRQVTRGMPGLQDMAGYMGQKTRDVGQGVQRRADQLTA